MELTKNVYFVGFMGAGKSTIARRLARIAGVASLDMDKYIERANGHSIPEIFEEGGEALFRDIELQTLKELANKDEHMLISCGGGIVETDSCREVLNRPDSVVIHLQIDSDDAADRIHDTASRPMFKDRDQARSLSSRRLPLYEEVADLTINTADKNVWEISNEAIRFLREKGVLCQQQE